MKYGAPGHHLVLLEDGRSAPVAVKGNPLRADLPFFEDDAEAVVDGLVTAHDQAYGLLSLQLPGSSISLQLAHGALALGKSVRIR
jgi:molybdate transport system ATP-binding protein